MRTKLLFLSIAVCLSTTLPAQNDSLRNEILRYQNPKAEIINKGRQMTFDRFLDNDKKKVRELLDYLINIEEDEDYVAFYPAEKWLLYYWVGHYDKILEDIRNYDPAYEVSWRRKIPPPQDMLLIEVKENLITQQKEILNQIRASDLRDVEKGFLVLNFDYLMINYPSKDFTQDSLNISANQYLQRYPDTLYEDYVRKYIQYEVKPSKWGFGFEFFSGYGIFTDDLAKNFKHNVPIGVAFDVYYKHFVLYLRDYIGFSKTTDSIRFNSGTWRSDEQVRVYLPEASLGFVAIDKERIKAVPFAGISSTDVSPTEYDKNRYPEYEDLGLEFTTTYTVGFNLDIKLGKSRIPMVSMGPEQSYWFIRMRYAYNKPQFDWKYNGFRGDFHYLTIGIGGFGRALKRDY